MSLLTNKNPIVIKQDHNGHKKNEIILFIILIVIVQVSFIYSLHTDERLNILKKDFTNPVFVSIFTIIVIIVTLGIIFSKGKTRNAIRNGATGFIISYLARLNLSFAVFFIIGFFAYFTDTNVYV